MFSNLTTIGAQSGKKWYAVVKSKKEQNEVGASKRVISSLYKPGAAFKGTNASGKLSSDSGRKGPNENSGRFLGGTAQDRLEVLRNQRNRRYGTDLSHEGVGKDRRKTREGLLSQPFQTEVFGAGELLRPSSGGGWAGAHSNSTHATGISANEGRSRRSGPADLPGSLESRAVPGSTEP